MTVFSVILDLITILINKTYIIITFATSIIKTHKMNKNIIICLLAFLFSVQAVGQEKVRKLDVRLGAGLSLLGTGDMRTFNYENELNLKLNKMCIRDS